MPVALRVTHHPLRSNPAASEILYRVRENSGRCLNADEMPETGCTSRLSRGQWFGAYPLDTLWCSQSLLPHPYTEKCPRYWRLPMDYLLEAKKFIQRAREAWPFGLERRTLNPIIGQSHGRRWLSELGRAPARKTAREQWAVQINLHSL